MSHFTVMVIGDDVDEQLAPYQENNMDDCPEEYLEFVDVVENERYDKTYEEDSLNVYTLNGVSTIQSYLNDARHLYRECNEREFDEARAVGVRVQGEGYGDRRVCYRMRENVVITKQPIKEHFSFDKYMTDYQGYKYNTELGKYGYYENPNAKWDWYQVGGRWSGFFKLKNGSTADVAEIQDIDLEAMRDEAEAQAREKFKAWEEVFQKHDRPKEWKTVNESYKDIDEARRAYHAQPAIIAMRKNKLLEWSTPNDLGYDKEKYISDKRNGACSPYAVVKDYEWYSIGEMGWWGISRNESSEEDWNKQVSQIMDELPEGTLITLVDCHI